MTHALLYNRTGQPVRRDSLDLEDPRAQVARPIEHGLAFVDAITQTLDEWDEYRKGIGLPYEFGLSGRLVLRALLRCTDFSTGVCEPCLDTLQRMTKLARATVVRALKLLFRDGFVNWIRRTVKTGAPPGEGPQVKQVSNAYWFDTGRLPARCLARMKQLLRKKGKVFKPADQPRFPRFEGLVKRRREAIRDADAYRRKAIWNAQQRGDHAEAARLAWPTCEESQRSYVEMMSEGASSADGLNPPPRVKNQKE